MRYKFIILSFFIQLLAQSQVGPPSLRCLAVINNNGDLRATWIPPTDPQSNFFGYEINVAKNKQGPYTVVSATAGSINDASFVVSTTVTTVQSVFIYVRSRYGAGGANSSISSDTLRSLFLNINASLPETYGLVFNDLHNPKLSTSAPTVSIWQEYPPGTWKILKTTDKYSYNDTLSICNKQNAIINYSVSMTDNSGCTSISNIQGGVYSDRHSPFTIYMDSISVLPNGNTIIGWNLPAEKDVAKYEIQQKNSQGQNQSLTFIQGYNNTSYTLANTAANNGTVGLYVQAIDSCNNGGTFVDYEPATMFLKSYYNYCKFETQLDWTPYRWAKKNGTPIDEVLEYRVYMSEDSGLTFTRLGVTTGLSFKHSHVSPTKNIIYFVRVINKRMTMTASSNRTVFYSGQVLAPAFVYLQSVGVIKKNSTELRLYIDPLRGYQRLVIERSNEGQKFDSIGNIPFTGLANYSFEDKRAETESRFYYYRVRIIDSCGNNRLTSNVCKTILLKVTEDPDDFFKRHLSWTAYEGFDAGVRNYQVYRAINDIREVELIGQVDSAGSFTDNLEFAATLGANIEYYVKANEAFGNRYALQDFSTSNFARAFIDGRVFVPNAFAPDGHNRTWKPVVQFIENMEYSVVVHNRWGQVVFSTSNQNESWDGNNCPNDIYNYLISYRNSRGEYQQVIGSVMLIR